MTEATQATTPVQFIAPDAVLLGDTIARLDALHASYSAILEQAKQTLAAYEPPEEVLAQLARQIAQGDGITLKAWFAGALRDLVFKDKDQLDPYLQGVLQDRVEATTRTWLREQSSAAVAEIRTDVTRELKSHINDALTAEVNKTSANLEALVETAVQVELKKLHSTLQLGELARTLIRDAVDGDIAQAVKQAVDKLPHAVAAECTPTEAASPDGTNSVSEAPALDWRPSDWNEYSTVIHATPDTTGWHPVAISKAFADHFQIPQTGCVWASPQVQRLLSSSRIIELLTSYDDYLQGHNYVQAFGIGTVVSNGAAVAAGTITTWFMRSIDDDRYFICIYFEKQGQYPERPILEANLPEFNHPALTGSSRGVVNPDAIRE